MNEWIRRSIQIAEERDYLDQLSRIYRVQLNPPRPVDPELIRRITEFHERRQFRELIELLIDHGKFPYREPFLGFLKADRGAMDRNPETIRRISGVLQQMQPIRIIEGIEEAPEPDRQFGGHFRQWVGMLPYSRLAAEEFLHANTVCVLDGGDATLLNFANDHLNCGLEKGPDLLAKTSNGYVVAEAKFITDTGGNQGKSLREILDFIRAERGDALRVGIVDGVIWVKRRGKFAVLRNVEQIAMTALLLEEFLRNPGYCASRRSSCAAVVSRPPDSGQTTGVSSAGDLSASPAFASLRATAMSLRCFAIFAR